MCLVPVKHALMLMTLAKSGQPSKVGRPYRRLRPAMRRETSKLGGERETPHSYETRCTYFCASTRRSERSKRREPLAFYKCIYADRSTDSQLSAALG